jgi:hypothetical protein
MAAAKLASKRNRRRKALRVLGLAGVSLSLAGGASASTSGSATDIPAQKVTPPHEIILGEEEISDVSLSTFYVFDKENVETRPGIQLAQRGCRGCGGGRGCGGCRGCGGFRGCRGCGGCGGGCGGCCLSWGRCAIC